MDDSGGKIEDNIEKILHNLLSNAFKYCNSGDRIDVFLRYSTDPYRENCQAELEIADTGPGLNKDQQEHLFDRFYRASSKYKSDREASGIGLSLVKELVELYGGSIRVVSEPGVGSRFIVTLPYGIADFKKEEILEGATVETNMNNEAPVFNERSENRLIATSAGDLDLRELPCILIVEDNDDLRNYMIRHLEDELCVLQAENDRKGLEMALERQPDLIISDLMMPEMDGVEMVEQLRIDERSCHIPVIMLTARGDLESKLECFEKGSDAFMEKPFKMEELKTRIHQLIKERQKLKEYYLKIFRTNDEVLKRDFPKADFVASLESYLRKNLSDSELTIDKLSRDMGFSRIQLYRKVQHSTGMFPGEWVRNVRLARASQLFREGAESVTKVMLEVGFTNPSHFANCFRELYGYNPSTYKKKVNRN